jgi:fructosamine-3-kinase
MTKDLKAQVFRVFGLRTSNIRRMSGGDVSEVFQMSLVDGTELVAKVEREQPEKLELEAYMLRYLVENTSLPVPDVLHCENGVLFLQFISGESSFAAEAQEHAAELLGALHNIKGPAFGFDVDTLIGGLEQPNQWDRSWLNLFRDQRLLYMAQEAVSAGRLPLDIFRSIDCFCADLETWLDEPDQPGLIHGDAWTGNILSHEGRIVGFLDPAIYFADPEIELAFTTLFNTFNQSFFGRYNEIRPIRPGFFEERRDIYNLYPLLVHVRLFGGSYIDSVKNILHRFGY